MCFEARAGLAHLVWLFGGHMKIGVGYVTETGTFRYHVQTGHGKEIAHTDSRSALQTF